MDFQLADIADERLGLTGQTIGFLPQGAQSIVDPASRAFGVGRRLLREREREAGEEKQRDEAGGSAAAYGRQTS